MKSPNDNTYGGIARVTFLVYLFFIFFGTSMPFQDRAEEVDDISTSNVVNQIVFTTLFLTSTACLFHKREKLFSFIKREKFLTLFLVWCTLSAFWSEYSFVSFKRLFQTFTTVTVSLAFLLDVANSDEALNYLKWIVYLYIPLTALSIVFIPGAIDPVHFTWRGLAVGKNYLGQAAIVSIIIAFFAMKSATAWEKPISLLILIISVVLLFGAKSTTSILTFAIIIMLGVIRTLDEFFVPLSIGRAFSIASLLFVIGVILSVHCLAPHAFNAIPQYFGKDISFTGRTDLWTDIFTQTKRHWLLGWGFAGFWVVGHPPVMQLYEEYIWLPNQAHLGYLDIWNETGLVGLLLFCAMVISYSIGLAKLKRPHFWNWILISALILNLQESTLFKQNLLTGVMFIFAYLALHAELLQRERAVRFSPLSADFHKSP